MAVPPQPCVATTGPPRYIVAASEKWARRQSMTQQCSIAARAPVASRSVVTRRVEDSASLGVYARGMLVAFLTDLAMLEQSKGKRSVEDLLKDLYLKHRKPTPPTDGNTSVIEMLKTRANATSIVEKYVTGTDKIEWANELAAAGIEDSDPGPLTALRVKEKLKGGQKAMLDKLGYNNWRKLSAPSK